MKGTEYEELQTLLPGERVLRLKRKRGIRLRFLSWPELTGVIKDLVFETPFFMMVPILIALLLVFSAGIYFAEFGAPGSNVDSYGEALWDAVVLMTTAGTMSEPVTGMGHVLGAIWTILGCLLFYGTIIASASAYFLLPLSSYFLLPRRGRHAKLIGTIQYNLGMLERLSVKDLEALKNETMAVIDSALERAKRVE